MENDMIKDWNFIKGVLQTTPNQTKNRPYLTKEEEEKFQKKMRRALREKKLKRILNI